MFACTAGWSAARSKAPVTSTSAISPIQSSLATSGRPPITRCAAALIAGQAAVSAAFENVPPIETARRRFAWFSV